MCLGMEASGHARWFERLLAELNFELWIGDAAEIRGCTADSAVITGRSLSADLGSELGES